MAIIKPDRSRSRRGRESAPRLAGRTAVSLEPLLVAPGVGIDVDDVAVLGEAVDECAEARLRMRRRARCSSVGDRVPLDVYAHVRAALAEEFRLGDVIKLEGIDPATWTAADFAWKQRLAANAESFTDFERELACAEDWLGREVTPLGEDLAAWVAFLDAYLSSPSQFELVTGLGMRMSDVARLQRRWTLRMKANSALEKQALTLRKKPQVLPEIRCRRVGAQAVEECKASRRKGGTTPRALSARSEGRRAHPWRRPEPIRFNQRGACRRPGRRRCHAAPTRFRQRERLSRGRERLPRAVLPPAPLPPVAPSPPELSSTTLPPHAA